MANTTKIVFIGAGSAAFGLSLFQDLFTTTELAGSTLTLVDTNPEALERMAALARVLNERGGAGILIETTTDRRAALPGARFVLNAVAIDRNRLWKLDFEVPKKHGIRHTLGENGGPGGLFFTLRTLPLIFDIARDVEELCPDALFINLSNPESRIVLGLAKYTSVRTLGLCHGIFLARWFICQILGMAEKEVDVWGAGLNHFQWLTAIRERATGRDLYPLLREREKDYDPAFTPLTRRMFNAFGLWVSCSDDHMGEYVPYGWEGGEHGFDFENDERGRVILKDLMDGVIDGSKPIPEDWTRPSWGERAVAVICGMTHNQKRFIESGVVMNRGVVPGLPHDLAVEVPLVADAAGVHPVSLGPLPDPITKLLSIQASVQQLAVEAAVRGSKELALQALLIDPVINSTTAALAILDELWEANKPYIRPCV
ncbi:alpha-glucosidase/alpha-galactosidase [Azospirillum thermophilum]|uniref:Alpha-glucosidase/alpha-galactosidase n=1 Tax=Azospirillum thermophilum TaxID=2202148 RepID=A0A2S2CZZ5_9PROT|nr:alpha-glucosidase/alpha-galactosidase [Azospirillum thermophilum]AWK90076.1 alpha-glucosidase/alpha-galactosidase [Azospirillum thermophilum]